MADTPDPVGLERGCLLKTHKVTKEHRDYFLRACEQAQHDFGLLDWDIHLISQDMEDHEAVVDSDYGHHSATIALARAWDRKPTKKRLRETAIHEMVHVLIAPVTFLGNQRYGQYEHHKEAVEGVTVRLARLLDGAVASCG